MGSVTCAAVQALIEKIPFVQDFFSGFDDFFTLRRGDHTVGAAFQKLYAHTFFQINDCIADGRLRNKKMLGGSVDGVGLVYVDQIL